MLFEFYLRTVHAKKVTTTIEICMGVGGSFVENASVEPDGTGFDARIEQRIFNTSIAFAIATQRSRRTSANMSNAVMPTTMSSP
ncbi:hypothetical protein EVAR_31875_1 [Eumeta japonica]|uniref:Uncharacterized protein n=1 Tax=Eumeta variegata TaxID=151549 RepID=A0A4C1WZ72_EUMVA|nr:hypothetical protein EVAR_31875_1 [Eumeta japonica]